MADASPQLAPGQWYLGLPEGDCLRCCGHRFLMQGAQHHPHAAAVLSSIGSCSLAHGSHGNPNWGSEPQISTEKQDVPKTWLPSSAEIQRVLQDTGPPGITHTIRQHLCRNSHAVTTHGDTVTQPPAQCHPLCFGGGRSSTHVLSSARSQPQGGTAHPSKG